MQNRLIIAVFLTGLLPAVVTANDMAPLAFVDGLWHGEMESGSNGKDFKECWASTTFDDGTTFTLTNRKDERWFLKLSNPGWHLPRSHRYAMVAQVDFYPTLRIVAEAKNQTLLEVADLDHIALLGLIENGHTIDLTSDGFNEKYELEGSAKIIERLRNCDADRSGPESP